MHWIFGVTLHANNGTHNEENQHWIWCLVVKLCFGQDSAATQSTEPARHFNLPSNSKYILQSDKRRREEKGGEAASQRYALPYRTTGPFSHSLFISYIDTIYRGTKRKLVGLCDEVQIQDWRLGGYSLLQREASPRPKLTLVGLLLVQL